MKTCYWFILSIIVCSMIQHVQSYCVYNKSLKKSMWFIQSTYQTTATQLSRFKSHEMPPFSRQCCPYTNSDCSQSGTKEQILLMELVLQRSVRYTIDFPAGGWIDVKDSGDEWIVKFEVYHADGSPYNFKFMDDDAIRQLENQP